MAQQQLSTIKFVYFVRKKQAVTAQVVPLCLHYASLQDGTPMEDGTQESDGRMQIVVHSATKSPPWTHPSIPTTRRKTKGQQRQFVSYASIMEMVGIH